MTENKVEILPLVAEDHELITTKLDEFNFDKDDAEKLEDTLINCMDFYRGLGLSANNTSSSSSLLWSTNCKDFCNTS